jgi:hypothetical protein
MKLLVFKTDENFVPFLLRLEKTFTATLSAHDMFMWTSWIIIEYQARSISNTPVDRERSEVVNAIIMATNRLVAAMEAIIAGDLQMALARTVHCYLPLVAFMAQIEARRFTANNGSSVIEDVLSNDAASAPSEIQSLAIQMERQRKLTEAIIPGNSCNTMALGPSTQLVQSGRSVSSPTALDPSAPSSSVIPYTSHLDLTSLAEGLPTSQQQQQQQQQHQQKQHMPPQAPTSTSRIVFDLNVNSSQPRNPYNINRQGNNNNHPGGKAYIGNEEIDEGDDVGRRYDGGTRGRRDGDSGKNANNNESRQRRDGRNDVGQSGYWGRNARRREGKYRNKNDGADNDRYRTRDRK